ncbi:fatty acid desaturase [Planktotalea arctica]|uniref:fatty acid desaturase n=1 Tax=Planktotalea arctica TaxID=1481893 RepID=UPI000A17704C|nr:fatty acid desaturase [Planktotalea arctica]
MTTDPRTQNFNDAREWVSVLAKYREPDTLRSSFELGVSVIPFIALWAFACWMASFSYTAAFVIAVLNGGFLLRMFCIQHDCGHGSFYDNRTLSDWVGRTIGVFTLTPYDVWRRTHSIHHSHAGDLDHRGIGDVMTLTVEEYNARTPFGRFLYRLYRHPAVLFGLGPTYLFIFQNRLPLGLMKQGKKYWISAMGTNFAAAVIAIAIVYFIGWQALVLVTLPTILIAASIGVWLFYVQHQFEDTHWKTHEDWQLHEAALHGSSHYDLPPVLRWFTANIGIHHVHHLYSRIPFYRLGDVLRDHEELVECGRMTLMQSFKCARLDLWDGERNKLVSFKEAKT